MTSPPSIVRAGASAGTRITGLAARDDAEPALVRAAVCLVVGRHLQLEELTVLLPAGPGAARRRLVALTGTLTEVAEALLSTAPSEDPGTEAVVAFAPAADRGPAADATGRAELAVRVDRAGHGLWVEVEHGSGTGSRLPLAALLRQVELVLAADAADPARPALELPLLDDDEARALLLERNATRRTLRHAGTLHAEFLATAARQPDAVALIEAPDRRWTFGELAAAVRRRARQLRALGAGPETRVGIYLRPSAEMLVACLAANAAGAGFVPLDPGFPPERRRAMLAAARCCVVLTSSALGADARAVAPAGTTVTLVDAASDPAGVPDQDLPHVVGEDVCYVMFTSGSTGVPKGIALRHQGVLNNLADLRDRFGIGPGDAVLTLSSPAFDMSVVELLGIPLAGGTAVVPEASVASSPRRWAELVESASVTVWNSVPALAELFVRHLERTGTTAPGLRLAMLGGDWVPLDLPDRFRARAPRLELVALGGATEASVHSTVYRVAEVDPAWASVPYGRPMANQRVYVLDPRRQPVPVGVPGELYLAGTGLARGYVGGADHDRFSLWRHPLVGTERVYRTGDLVVWRPDGNLELLGRVDLQLKIHGVRLEARAIETELGRHPAVRAAAAVVTGTEERRRRLTAFVVLAPGRAASATELREFLAVSLAPREIPSVFVFLESLPLNASGKVNRRALSARTFDRTDGSAAGPVRDADAGTGTDIGTEAGLPGEALTVPVVAAGPGASNGPRVEPADEPDDRAVALRGHVASVWSAALGTEVVDPDSNFFLIGGDSFTALTIIDTIHPGLSLQDLFANPTVAGLARRMHELDLA